jgi:hypothetical protein
VVSVGVDVGGMVVVAVVVGGEVVVNGVGKKGLKEVVGTNEVWGVSNTDVEVVGASVTGTVVKGTVEELVVVRIVDVVGISHVVVVSGIEVVEDVVDGGSPGNSVVVGNSARVVVEDTSGGSDVVTSVVVVGSVCNPL